MIKRAIAVLTIVSILTGVEGKEEEIETEIGFYLTKEDRYPYEVRVSEGGYVIDGRQRITNGIVAYELSVGQRKKFVLEAKEGYELEEIVINGKVEEREVKEIEIQGVSAKSELEVRYEKKEETYQPDETESLEVEKEEREILSTGDLIETSSYLWIVVLIVYWIYGRQRGIDTRECEDIKKEEGGKER